MDLKEKTLIELLQHNASRHAHRFPGNGAVNYSARYTSIADYLNVNVHPYVNNATLLQDDGYLTDHGPKHVAKVISRASQLVSAEKCNLMPYEVYMLLVAIHLHDVGNIYGRERHEEKSARVMDSIGKLAGEDSAELHWIWEIAKAHGGNVDGDKDRISKLPESEPVLSQKVRVQMLAAILKFADELADDSERADRYLLQESMIPGGSEVFHKYAEALHSVIVDSEGKEVALHFSIPASDLKRKFGKGEEQVYLLDEIFQRTTKTHLERIYCSRFMRPSIAIDAVKVKISIYKDKFQIDEDAGGPIGYRLQEYGYPELHSDGIYSLCPQLKNWKDGKPLNGEILALQLSNGAT